MGALRDINFVKNLFFHPCATPSPQIIVQTGFAAGRVALMELLSLGCIDIMASRAGISPYAKDHFGQLINPLKPSKTAPQGPHHRGLKGVAAPPKLMTKMGTGYSLGDLTIKSLRAPLYYPWLIGVGINFFANWASLIYQMAECSQPGAGYFSFPAGTIFSDCCADHSISINGIGTKPCIGIAANNIHFPLGCVGIISYSLPFVPFLGNPLNQGNVETWIEDHDGNRFAKASTRPPDDPTSDTAGAAFRTRPTLNPNGVTYSIKFKVLSGIMGCPIGVVNVSAYGKHIPLVPAGCSPKPVTWPFPT